MKNFAKSLGIIAMVAVIGFSMAACDDGSKDDNGGGGSKSASIEATANGSGEIEIRWGAQSNDTSCEITTNLPSPNDKFILTLTSQGDPNSERIITGLTPSQKVTITVTFSSDSARLESQNNGSIITIFAD
jgi:hypothetical protein